MPVDCIVIISGLFASRKHSFPPEIFRAQKKELSQIAVGAREQ